MRSIRLMTASLVAGKAVSSWQIDFRRWACGRWVCRNAVHWACRNVCWVFL